MRPIDVNPFSRGTVVVRLDRQGLAAFGITIVPEADHRALGRAGDHQKLAQIWEDPRWIPTPNEIDAPGLWLARIDLPE